MWGFCRQTDLQRTEGCTTSECQDFFIHFFIFPHPDFAFLFFILTFFPDKCGVLIVKILEIFEECTIQVAICQQLEQSPATLSSEDAAVSAGGPILKVLFARETAAHLKSRPHDVVHIYPPWWVGRAGHARRSRAKWGGHDAARAAVGKTLGGRGEQVSCLWQLERLWQIPSR